MADKAATAAVYGGSATAFFTPILEWLEMTPADMTLALQMGGFWVGVVGLAASLWFQWDKRRREIAAAGGGE